MNGFNHYLRKVGKIAVYLFVLTTVIFNGLLAETVRGQAIKSVKEAKISIEINNESIEKSLKMIEQNSDYKFVYKKNELRKKANISLDVENQTLENLLLEISKQANVSFRQINDRISVKSHKNADFEEKVTIEEQRTVSGNILDENGEPLPGASIVVKGTTVGTTTDFEGNFQLNVSDSDILTVSFVGYKALEIPVANRTSFNFKMEPDAEQLADVVVVGYGTQRKVNLTGSVGVADGEVLQNRPIPNVGEGLKGVVPNLNINIRNGDPSVAPDFNIRGFESINGGNPLILVDNVPIDDLNRINPNDIESISVLKDAAASAVYGSRAAFGVILVTTKKGQGDKINVNFSGEFALAKPILFLDPITDPYQFVLARNEASIRTNGAPAYDQNYVDGTRAWSENPTQENAWGVFNDQLRFYGYNNYVNELITDFAPQQRYDLSVSGASDKASYYASFGVLNKDGYLKNKEKNENYKRYNVLLKGDFNVNNWLNLDSRALVTTETSDKPHFYHWDVNINTSARQNPLDPIKFPDLPFYLTPGDRDNYSDLIGRYFGGTNFLPYLEDGGRETWMRNDIFLTQGATITPLKGWNIRGAFTANFTYRDYQDVQSKIEVVRENPDLTADLATLIDNGFSGNDWINNRTDFDQYYTIQAYTDYTFEQGSHYFKAMAGFNQEWGLFKYHRAQAFSLITPQITDINATVGNQLTFGGKQQTALRGVFYRLNYIFDDKYLIETNGRYDGTSRFPTDDRFGFFPSVSVGWRISNEAFMSGTSSWLDNLKLRASYGELGNQLLVDDDNNPIYYPYIATLGISNTPYMMSAGSQTPAVSPAGLVSPSLTWETVVSQNIGLDFAMFGNRLDVAIDAYIRDTKGMLTSVELPEILGTSAPDENTADLRTRGWEVAATWRDNINNDWSYNVTLALSDNLSKITKYDNPTGAIDEYYEGQVVSDAGGERWGYETVGIFQTDQEVADAPSQNDLGWNLWRAGDIRYADLNGDGTINDGNRTLDNPGDLKIIAYENPRYNFGITTNVSWKSLSLNVFFEGIMKYDYWPPNGNWVAFYPFNAGHVENYYLTDTWSPENPDAYFPAPHISTNTKQNVLPQTRYVQDASYIRLKNLTLAYNLPANIASKAGMTTAQVYFAGMNLWEATKMRKPLDPEVRPTLTQEYYKQRIFSLGFRVGF
ncbi:MAG: TonB-dependent receptor [Cyclobacteriaceae bacterium]